MLSSRSIRHCKACGAATDYLVPPDDNRPRAVCSSCKDVHYENPLNVVGTVPIWGEQVLLCRRNSEPRHGFWTLPAGFMELGETTAEGAERETVEEAGARIELQGLFTLLNVVRVGQVHLFYRATLLHLDFDPGPESLEARLFTEAEIPWDDIAFRTVGQTLRWFFEDRSRDRFELHTSAIRYTPRPAA
jgi:ADP-ribose pyrophosphatase YjhB (NUDIX family)